MFTMWVRTDVIGGLVNLRCAKYSIYCQLEVVMRIDDVEDVGKSSQTGRGVGTQQQTTQCYTAMREPFSTQVSCTQHYNAGWFDTRLSLSSTFTDTAKSQNTREIHTTHEHTQEGLDTKMAAAWSLTGRNQTRVWNSFFMAIYTTHKDMSNGMNNATQAKRTNQFGMIEG